MNASGDRDGADHVARGGCHCGAIRFDVLRWPDRRILIDCNCSICAKTGFLHLIVPRSAFRLTHGQEAQVEYRFNTGQAIHWFCGRCGIKPFYRPRSHPDGISINARCLDEPLDENWVSEPFNGRQWSRSAKNL